MPSPVLESLKYAAYSIACIGIFSVGSSFFPIEHCYSDEFAESSMGYKFFYANLAGMFHRYFYYTAFLFQTGTAIASGLGFNGRKEVSPSDDVDPKDSDRKGAPLWDKIVGVYVLDVELATNINTTLHYWNMRVHIWIKYYISERLAGKGQRPTTVHYLLTFFTSAFWHGFYPFYYITFSYLLLSSFAHKDVYNMWYLFRNIPSPIRRVICTTINNLGGSYVVLCVNARIFDKGLKFLGATYYYGFVFMFAVLIISRGFGLLSISKKMERADKEL